MILKRLFLLLILYSFNFSTVFAQDFNKEAKTKLNESNAELDNKDTLIVDSDINIEKALAGINIPEAQKKQLELITVYYFGFDKKLHQGQLVVNKNAAEDLIVIFNFILESKFPVEKVIPISKYNWSDENSMNDNNTSCFNYRFISGSRILSKHAAGLAIDINPLLNPYVKDNKTSPENSNYNVNVPGTISSDSPITAEFKKLGWIWGGDWKGLKDYQHFQKNSK